jgi:hypothetical protein
VAAEAVVGRLRSWTAEDVTGSFAYVPNVIDNDVQTYSINQTSGALTSLGTTTAVSGTQPSRSGHQPRHPVSLLGRR